MIYFTDLDADERGSTLRFFIKKYPRSSAFIRVQNYHFGVC
jgi:hypothetical protein